MIATDTKLSQMDIEHLPNYRRKTPNEWSSACPFCGAGDDRFLYWPDKGNYFCRVCEAKGFVTEANTLSFSQEQYDEWKRAQNERRVKERAAQLAAIEKMSATSKADFYHRQMVDRSYWYSQGLNDHTINKFNLGYSPSCPTCPESPSWTIPITYQSKLYNIRHRLAIPDGKGKYRPEMAGLPAVMFNADTLDSGEWMIVLVEGEVKAMVLEQYGFPAVGIPGATSFKDKWIKLFPQSSSIYVALDPGAEKFGEEITRTLNSNGITAFACYFPVKPDDFIVRYHGTPSEMSLFLGLGRRLV